MKEGLTPGTGTEDGEPTHLMDMKEGLVLRVGIADGIPLQDNTRSEPAL